MIEVTEKAISKVKSLLEQEKKQDHGLYGLPDHRPGMLFMIRPFSQISVDLVYELHNRAYGRIKVKAIFDIRGNLLYCLMTLSINIFKITLQFLFMVIGDRVCEIIQIIRYEPPYPAEKPERSFHTLITPFEIPFRWRSKKAEHPDRVRSILIHKFRGVDHVLF